MSPVNKKDRSIGALSSVVNDDAALMRCLVARDVVAFEAFYKAYYGKVARFVMNVVRRPHLVEEVVNDTMMVVWTKPQNFNGMSKLSTWVFGIAYRQSMNALRRLDEPVDVEIADVSAAHDETPEHDLGSQMARASLAKAIATLSAAHRTVIDLTYVQGLGYVEIAEIMDCPVDTVKTRMFYARRHLKQRLAGTKHDWI